MAADHEGRALPGSAPALARERLIRSGFADRTDAGRQLAARVRELGLPAPVVLALPRGGVPVAAEVASALGASLDVIVARKVGAPGQPELGIGAIAEGGGRVVDEASVRAFRIDDDELAARIAAEQRELARRVAAYRQGRPLPDLEGADVVLVDDGLATGVTAEAALRSLRAAGARRLVLAVPVTPTDTAARLAHLADDVVWVLAPRRFGAVGSWYADFEQVTDEEVVELLAEHRVHE